MIAPLFILNGCLILLYVEQNLTSSFSCLLDVSEIRPFIDGNVQFVTETVIDGLNGNNMEWRTIMENNGWSEVTNSSYSSVIEMIDCKENSSIISRKYLK